MTVFSGISEWIRNLSHLFARGVYRKSIIANGETFYLNPGIWAYLTTLIHPETGRY